MEEEGTSALYGMEIAIAVTLSLGNCHTQVDFYFVVVTSIISPSDECTDRIRSYCLS